LSTRTDGFFFSVDHVSTEAISHLTLSVLLAWMHVDKPAADGNVALGTAMKYKSLVGIDEASDEAAQKLVSRFYTHKKAQYSRSSVSGNIERIPVTVTNMSSVMPNRGPIIFDMAARYAADQGYRNLAVAQLRTIIDADVFAISVNPIFGTLWRAVCNDRKNKARDELVTLFGDKISHIEDDAQKAAMKAWLQDSYHHAAEIQDILAAIPAHNQFPAVYVDPTMAFAGGNGDGKGAADFTRDELLEIARSCHPLILGRLGKVLTQLQYVRRKEDLPKHIKEAEPGQVPIIPLALAEEQYQCQFWKLLLHAVLPGTKLASRPAALLAALALRMGITTLQDVADMELIRFQNYWNKLDTPETWNMECLGLLLDADRDYENRVEKGITIRTASDVSILKDEDRQIFKMLVDYKMLELNLKTTLEARAGWKPVKSSAAMGPVVVCAWCKFPRSVSVMTNTPVCGLCVTKAGRSCICPVCISSRAKDMDAWLRANVSHDHDQASQACWVECSRKVCRAQYVVYHPKNLNVGAKCFYCRHNNGKSAKGQAPVVECSKCSNRMIWPPAHRPTNFDASTFECYACVSGVVSILTHETNAENLARENGTGWLLEDTQKLIRKPFDSRSVFQTASRVDLTRLRSAVKILPQITSRLTISGKPIINEDELKANLEKWVVSRQVETGTCSLCFSDGHKANLQRACGRSGCHQLICGSCKGDWYGINRRGRIINVSALCCPFCRRQPARKVVSKFDIVKINGLRKAIEDTGNWIYAWCDGCGFARPYMGRSCAAGAPGEVEGWKCRRCLHPNAVEFRTVHVRECPGCGVATHKTHGCDHITCPCGMEWWYVDGKELFREYIYTDLEMDTEYDDWWEAVPEEDEDYVY
jgi:hypothetical protein